jgi:hypothetical protein
MPLIQRLEARCGNPRVVDEDIQPMVLRDRLLLSCGESSAQDIALTINAQDCEVDV